MKTTSLFAFKKSTNNYEYLPLKIPLLCPGKIAKYKKGTQKRVKSVKNHMVPFPLDFLNDALGQDERKN